MGGHHPSALQEGVGVLVAGTVYDGVNMLYLCAILYMQNDGQSTGSHIPAF